MKERKETEELGCRTDKRTYPRSVGCHRRFKYPPMPSVTCFVYQCHLMRRYRRYKHQTSKNSNPKMFHALSSHTWKWVEPYVCERRTSHEPNRMQMRKTLCSPTLSFISIRFGSCEVRRLTPALALRSNISKTRASCFIGVSNTRKLMKLFFVFECLKPRWNTKHEFLKLLLQQKKISLNYHLNKFSQFNYYIWDAKYAWTSKNVYDVHGPITKLLRCDNLWIYNSWGHVT